MYDQHEVETRYVVMSDGLELHFENDVIYFDVARYVYVSSGDFGPVPLTAVDVVTGEIAWRNRTFARANLVKVGDRAVVLDEDGRSGW